MCISNEIDHKHYLCTINCVTSHYLTVLQQLENIFHTSFSASVKTVELKVPLTIFQTMTYLIKCFANNLPLPTSNQDCEGNFLESMTMQAIF